MLLVKLIKIAGILKDLELSQFFVNKESIDVKALIKHLESIDPQIVVEIAKIATDDKSIDNEVDAILALSAFFLPLVGQLRTSRYLPVILSHLSSLSSVETMIAPEK